MYTRSVTIEGVSGSVTIAADFLTIEPTYAVDSQNSPGFPEGFDHKTTTFTAKGDGTDKRRFLDFCYKIADFLFDWYKPSTHKTAHEVKLTKDAYEIAIALAPLYEQVREDVVYKGN